MTGTETTEPQVNAFEYNGATWRRLASDPVWPPSLKACLVVLDPECATWRWWACGRTGWASTLASAEAAAKEAWEQAVEEPVRYRVNIEQAARNPMILKATLYSVTKWLKRSRVVYGEPSFGHDTRAFGYQWSPERSDQPALTTPELQALAAGVEALEKHQAARNPLASYFEPAKVTADYPSVRGLK